MGHHLVDGPGGAGLGRRHVEGRGPGPAQVAVGAVEQLLVPGEGMDGRHQPAGDAERVVQHRQHRSQAVRRAGGGRDDVVAVGVVVAVVHADDDGEVLVAGGRRDQHLAGAGPEVGDGVVAVGEPAGGLDHDVDVEGVPGAEERVRLGRDPHRLTVESYLNRWAQSSGLARTELTTTTSIPGAARAIWRITCRPIRPKPLMATRTPVMAPMVPRHP